MLRLALAVLLAAPAFAQSVSDLPQPDGPRVLKQPVALEASVAETLPDSARVVLVVHGGAGVITRAGMTPETEAGIRKALEAALRAGHATLQDGGSATDAVTAAITGLEDDPHFNAGRGAVFTHDGRVELDASIMDGRTLAAGAVAGVTTVRHPILAARAVMEHSPHVMLVGPGAEAFAQTQGLERVENSFFYTDRRREALERILERERSESGARYAPPAEHLMGTVGAVALDGEGHLAAGTSTGGMTNKRWGRVGDAPVIGAGTYADDRACGVSATGHGEYFIRAAVTHDVVARMRYLGEDVETAAGRVIEAVGALGGTGGVIALDPQGRVAMPFNTEGMYRGTITADGRVAIAFYGPDEAFDDAPAHD